MAQMSELGLAGTSVAFLDYLKEIPFFVQEVLPRLERLGCGRLHDREGMMPAYLVVRAVVAEADRRDFDAWYRDEHLPDALKAFNAQDALARLEPHRSIRALRVLPVRGCRRGRSYQHFAGDPNLIAEFDRALGHAGHAIAGDHRGGRSAGSDA